VQLSNAFEVSATPERTWAMLNDVPRVVPCMPGAELIRTISENQWEAALRVKLGPISLQFVADVTRDEVDEPARRVRLTVRAREAKNRGGADATMESAVTSAGTGTRVDIITDLVLKGAVAQYGRGVVPEVARQLTAQFAQCLQRQLENDTPPEPEVIQPVQGLRLGLTALWGSIVARFRR
jgi:carbon monoxide dehydrogenase subunit G